MATAGLLAPACSGRGTSSFRSLPVPSSVSLFRSSKLGFELLVGASRLSKLRPLRRAVRLCRLRASSPVHHSWKESRDRSFALHLSSCHLFSHYQRPLPFAPLTLPGALTLPPSSSMVVIVKVVF